MGEEERPSSRSSPATPGTPLNKGREKKRVGFSTNNGLEGPAGGDYFTSSHDDGTSSSTPAASPGTGRGLSADAVDHRELHAALTQMLSNTASPQPLDSPNASYYQHQSRQQMSEREARERAHHLHDALGRNSHSEMEKESRHASLEMPLTADHAYTSGLSRSDSRAAAEALVRSHTRRIPKLSITEAPSLASDNFTYDATALGSRPPSPTAMHYEHDHVDPPERYHGGVLATLLRLYNAGNKTSSEGNTPVGTPGTSRASSPTGSSRPGTPRRSMYGVFPNRHNKRDSSGSLMNLIGSSTMLGAPGTPDMAAASKDRGRSLKPKKPQKRKKQEDEQIRITKHIAAVLSRHRYLTKLCRALMMYGAPTHRLEDYLKMSSRVLEIECQFLYIPGCMFISFDDSTTHTTEVKLIRVPQGIDLGRLRDVHGIYKAVVHDLMSVDDGTKRLEDVMAKKEKFNPWLRIPVYGLASMCVAPFAFQARFIDLPAAFGLGCIVGLLALVAAPSSAEYANVFEISAAVITSFLARALGSIRGGELFCFSALAQSSIALILPGYTVLCGALELQSHNMVAGSVRMVYAIIYTLFLGYGIMIGTTLYGVIDKNAASEPNCSAPLGREWYFLFVPLFTLCLCIINQAKWRQIPIMILIAFAGFCVNSYASDYFRSNAQISNTLGALCVGVLANLYSRLGPHCERFFLRIWGKYVEPRLQARRRDKDMSNSFYRLRATLDLEAGEQEAAAAAEEKAEKKTPGTREVVGYGLAAAAMLPAIFVQVPGGLAVNGSLLSGINAANQLNGNATAQAAANAGAADGVNSLAFTVLFSVLQVAIGITVGLFLSALIVYPFGKRRSAIFSF